MALRSNNPVLEAVKRGEQNTAANNQQAYYPPQYGQAPFQQQYSVPGQMPTTYERAITIDDVVTKTGITLGVLVVTSIISFVISLQSQMASAALTFIGIVASFILVLISTLGRKMQSAPVTILYAIFEGMWLGAFSQIVAGYKVGGQPAMGIIFGAIAGTIGVFIGMLVVYRIGAVRVTPKFTRILTGTMFGILAVIIVNQLISLILETPDYFGLYHGPVAIIFSLICIALAASSFLSDFDSADQAVRSGMPASYAWGIALGLTVTLVWLYTEILRFLSYFRD